MAAINCCKISGFDYSQCSTPKSHIKVKPQFCRANFGPNCQPFTLPRFAISHSRKKAVVQCFRVPTVSCLLGDGFEEFNNETEQSSFTNNSKKEAAIDLKLPRRSLLVTFTCDACGARSQRLINRLAYERGLVYVQCSGCSQYHKLVDNLGLVIEYNLHDEIDLDPSTDHA